MKTLPLCWKKSKLLQENNEGTENIFASKSCNAIVKGDNKEVREQDLTLKEIYFSYILSEKTVILFHQQILQKQIGFVYKNSTNSNSHTPKQKKRKQFAFVHINKHTNSKATNTTQNNTNHQRVRSKQTQKKKSKKI